MNAEGERYYELVISQLYGTLADLATIGLVIHTPGQAQPDSRSIGTAVRKGLSARKSLEGRHYARAHAYVVTAAQAAQEYLEQVALQLESPLRERVIDRTLPWLKMAQNLPLSGFRADVNNLKSQSLEEAVIAINILGE